MSLFSVTFGSAAGEAKEEQALMEAEDRLFEFDDMEADDLKYHVEKEAQRTRVFTWRIRTQGKTITRRVDRVQYTVIGIGILLFSKGTLSIADVQHFFQWLWSL